MNLNYFMCHAINVGAGRARNTLPLNSQKLEALLKWLDSDCDAAGKKYRTIQTGLIRIFAAKGFSDAEGLADDVIDRVADRLPQIGPNYEGDPAHYFRGVARNVVFEAGRRKEVATDSLPERPTKNPDVSDEYDCLLRCLKFFTAEKRDLILDYYAYEGGDKIANHIVMAEELKCSTNALRVQVHRARVQLQKCVLECVEALKAKQKPL